MEQTFTFKQKVILFIAGLLGPALINLLGYTWKIRVDGYREGYPEKHKKDKAIYCFWHSKLLGLCYSQKKKNIGILISSHFDGEIIARIVSRMGYYPLRGSSTRGGASGLLSMLKDDRVWYLAITVDGPRGPRGVVKPGIIYLASKSGLPIIPASCNSSKKWVLSSWDGFEIPRPFARVAVVLGKPFFVDGSADNSRIEEHSDRLANILNEMG
jgi:lysophospholipid acyltransferase (LPLAT)-like uncharacterized protein